MSQLGFESRIARVPALVVSQSDIAAFKRDRREWMLGTYLGLRPKHEPPLGPLRLGTRVHAALEQHYGMSYDLVEAYRKICERELEDIYESGIVFDRSAWDKEAELGRIMLEGYREWLDETGADADYETVSVEQKLSHIFDIDGTPVEVRGKIDHRVKDRFTGMHLVEDWKTTANMDALAASAPHSEQLLTYMLLERAVHKDDPDHLLGGAVFTMLRKVKRSERARPPFYDRVHVRHNETALTNYWKRLYGVLRDYVYVVKALDAGVDHRIVAYPSPANSTRWSPFRHVMTMMDDGSRVEAMLDDLFVQQDPHARYAVEPADILSDVA